MTDANPKPPENDVRRRPSRYHRRRRPVSWTGLIFGLMLGTASAIAFAWNVSPIEEFDTAPWQLRDSAKADYMVAIMVAYQHDGDLSRTIGALEDLRLTGDPIQNVADVACELARNGYADSTSGLQGVRAMMTFYQLQGRAGCADELIPLAAPQPTQAVIIAPTPTLPPPPTKTPTLEGVGVASPTPDGGGVVVPTNAPQSQYTLVRLESFCDAEVDGLIEVFVTERDGLTGIPGERVRVNWNDGESVFLTGLKPERGVGYADFAMEAGISYTIEMPGRSDPSQAFETRACVDERGEETLFSYRAFFRPSF